MKEIWDKFFANDHASVLAATEPVLMQNDIAELLHLSGLALLGRNPRDSGTLDAGMARLHAANAITPHSHWLSNAAISSLNVERHDDALKFAQLGVNLYPQAATHYFSGGNALMAQGKLVEAENAFRMALNLDPAQEDAMLNLGNCMRRRNEPIAALGCYDEVLTRSPGHAAALINRVGAMLEMGDTRGASVILQQIMAQADVPEVHFMLAMAKLAQGDYAEGWKLYRRRWDCGMAAADKATFRKPLLDTLEQGEGKHVLLFHEQGFGDSLQFVRYAPMLAERVGRVSMLTPEPLVRLFSALDPRINIVTTREAAGDYDFEVPMLDQARLFGTTVETIPAKIPYLGLAMPNLGSGARMGRKRIGLCWAGQLRPNPDLAAVDRRRSMQLSQFEPLLGVPNTSFVSLQLGAPAEQAGGKPWFGSMTMPLDGGFDFLDTAAVVKGLDLVISVDTAVAHLAAACGVPTWIMSRHDGCWRWLENRTDSPWYPGVVRLFQQRFAGDWSHPVEDITKALGEFVAATPATSG